MVFKPMISPKSSNKKTFIKIPYRFETIEEAIARLGENYTIYQHDTDISKWKVYFIKYNLVNSAVFDKKIILLEVENEQ